MRVGVSAGVRVGVLAGVRVGVLAVAVGIEYWLLR